VFLLRTHQFLASAMVFAAWLSLGALGGLFITRRRYASGGFAVALVLIGVLIAVTLYFLPRPM
jgi:hypothetical protein